MVVTVRDTSYHADKKLLHIWNNNSLEKLKKQNSDRAYIVDGRERIGKTTFAIQQMGFLDEKAFKDKKTFLSRICFTPDDFNRAVRETKNGVIIFDEAFRGLSSRSALSKVNKSIIQTLMEMGQNNNIVFIVLPTIFLLDIYPAMLRSDGLFHITQDKKNPKKRVWNGFSRDDKNQIFKTGIKKGWKYTKSTLFKGRFFKKIPYEKEYLEKKAKALKMMIETPTDTEIESRYKHQRDIMIQIFKDECNMAYRELERQLNARGVALTNGQMCNIVRELAKKPLNA